MSRIDLGLIDGNYWNAGHVDAVEAAINESSPAGEVVMTVAAVAPTGWLMLNGQVVPNAQTLYPDLWAVAPAAWKSGVQLTLPNAATRFPIGGGTVGSVGGSSSKTISAANLPVHKHTISGTTTDAVDHVHGGNGAHNHGALGGFPGDVKLLATGGPTSGSPAGISATGSGYIILPDHSTGPSGQAHQHDYSGNTGNVGSGTPLDATPAWIAFNFMIRCY